MQRVCQKQKAGKREHEGKGRGESWKRGKGSREGREEGRGKRGGDEVESLAKGCTQFYECWRGISEAMFGSHVDALLV